MARKMYEVALMYRVGKFEDNDFISKEFLDATDYEDAVEIAKEHSMKVDACDVICYFIAPETDYWQVFRETYVNGEYLRRIDY